MASADMILREIRFILNVLVDEKVLPRRVLADIGIALTVFISPELVIPRGFFMAEINEEFMQALLAVNRLAAKRLIVEAVGSLSPLSPSSLHEDRPNLQLEQAQKTSAEVVREIRKQSADHSMALICWAASRNSRMKRRSSRRCWRSIKCSSPRRESPI